jgi:hypothetical protein
MHLKISASDFPSASINPTCLFLDKSPVLVRIKSPTPASPMKVFMSPPKPSPNRIVSDQSSCNQGGPALCPNPIPSEMPAAMVITFFTAPPVSTPQHLHWYRCVVLHYAVRQPFYWKNRYLWMPVSKRLGTLEPLLLRNLAQITHRKVAIGRKILQLYNLMRQISSSRLKPFAPPDDRHTDLILQATIARNVSRKPATGTTISARLHPPTHHPALHVIFRDSG